MKRTTTVNGNKRRNEDQEVSSTFTAVVVCSCSGITVCVFEWYAKNGKTGGSLISGFPKLVWFFDFDFKGLVSARVSAWILNYFRFTVGVIRAPCVRLDSQKYSSSKRRAFGFWKFSFLSIWKKCVFQCLLGRLIYSMDETDSDTSGNSSEGTRLVFKE